MIYHLPAKTLDPAQNKERSELSHRGRFPQTELLNTHLYPVSSEAGRLNLGVARQTGPRDVVGPTQKQSSWERGRIHTHTRVRYWLTFKCIKLLRCYFTWVCWLDPGLEEAELLFLILWWWTGKDRTTHETLTMCPAPGEPGHSCLLSLKRCCVFSTGLIICLPMPQNNVPMVNRKQCRVLKQLFAELPWQKLWAVVTTR